MEETCALGDTKGETKKTSIAKRKVSPFFCLWLLRSNTISNPKREKHRYVVGGMLENKEWDPYWGKSFFFFVLRSCDCSGLTPHVADKVPKFQVLQAAKGKAYERNLQDRVANIQRLLKENPVKEAAIRAEKQKKKDVTPIESFLKKNKLL